MTIEEAKSNCKVGWEFNEKHGPSIIKRINYNGGDCPCHNESIDKHCPCSDYREKNICHCRLYLVKDDKIVDNARRNFKEQNCPEGHVYSVVDDICVSEDVHETENVKIEKPVIEDSMYKCPEGFYFDVLEQICIEQKNE